MKVFKELYQYREFLFTNVKKDIRGKYKASFLGVLWSFINPLLQVTVYAIVFPYLMRGQTIPNYLLFIICGIIPWTWFTMSMMNGTTCITNNGNLIKKVYFPLISFLTLVYKNSLYWNNSLKTFILSTLLNIFIYYFTTFSIHTNFTLMNPYSSIT